MRGLSTLVLVGVLISLVISISCRLGLSKGGEMPSYQAMKGLLRRMGNDYDADNHCFF